MGRRKVMISILCRMCIASRLCCCFWRTRSEAFVKMQRAGGVEKEERNDGCLGHFCLGESEHQRTAQDVKSSKGELYRVVQNPYNKGLWSSVNLAVSNRPQGNDRLGFGRDVLCLYLGTTSPSTGPPQQVIKTPKISCWEEAVVRVVHTT